MVEKPRHAQAPTEEKLDEFLYKHFEDRRLLEDVLEDEFLVRTRRTYGALKIERLFEWIFWLFMLLMCIAFCFEILIR